MSSITEPPASTVGINMTTETSNIATAVGAKRRKPNKVTQIQVWFIILYLLLLSYFMKKCQDDPLKISGMLYPSKHGPEKYNLCFKV